MGESPEAVRDLGAGRGRKRRGKRTINNYRFRYMAWGAERSDRVWSGVGGVGVGAGKRTLVKGYMPVEKMGSV